MRTRLPKFDSHSCPTAKLWQAPEKLQEHTQTCERTVHTSSTHKSLLDCATSSKVWTCTPLLPLGCDVGKGEGNRLGWRPPRERVRVGEVALRKSEPQRRLGRMKISEHTVSFVTAYYCRDSR